MPGGFRAMERTKLGRASSHEGQARRGPVSDGETVSSFGTLWNVRVVPILMGTCESFRITCGLYINISIHDYLRALMGFHQKNTPWTLDPRIKIPHGDDKTGVQRGIGNQVSVEFNLLYRFHSALSKRDREWSEEFFINAVMSRVESKDGIIDDQTGKPFKTTEEQIRNGEIPVPIFNKIIGADKNKGKSKEDIDTELAEELDRDSKAAFVPSGLQMIGVDKDTSAPTYKFRRDASGKFDDAELVAEMIQVIEDPICQFGGQNVPKIFKAIEILGILQARKWEVATLNEFRDFFGLKRHERFEDINEDKGITNALRDLYDDPDMVELYPGLLCEGKGRCLDPGTSGPNNGSTALWSGIFNDAVTLVRSDRFYTVDWNVGSLTSWGMHEVTADPQVLNGSVFHRLFQRAFPGYLKFNSVHLWQPLFTPRKNIELAKQQGDISSLDISDFKNGSIQSKGKAQQKIIKSSSEKVPDTVPKPTPVLKTSSYRDIRDKILGEYKAEFQNPGLLVKDIITGEYLQAMMTGTSPGFDRAAGIFQELFTPEIHTMFLDYFVKMSKEITEREKRSLQKHKISFEQEKKKLDHLRLSNGVLEREKKKLDDLERHFKEKTVHEQIYQIDIVKDYAIPVVTRFFVDFLGFWDCVQTPQHPNRQYNENEIYEHICNCQDYRSYNSDETTMWKRRLAFKKSIIFLREKAEYGARRARGFFGLIPRDNKTTGDRAYVVALRNFGVKVSKAFAKKLKNTDEVAAMMLVIALEAVHKSVMTFTEVLAYFIDHPHEKEPNVSNWIEIQNLAYENTPEAHETLKRYVLEAQRIRIDSPLVRLYSPTKPGKEFKLRLTNDTTDEITLRKGDRVLLDLRAAQECEKIFPDPKNGKSVDPKDAEIIFPNPSTLSLNPDDRKLKNYLIYGQDSHFTLGSKQITLLGLIGMIKYIALTKELRVAHDKLGRLKRAKTPEGVENYLTEQWNQLVPSPTTWSLRFNGEGRGVFADGDNADQGHGINQVYQIITRSDPLMTSYDSPAVSAANYPLATQNGFKKQPGTSYY
ncbi:hypothetical protein MMC07_004160 [Pseudocyphellaria aurata]|nr:hypothetical protein [Pseudocyphellaria aurata]